ncbi:5740_t:CDS:1, partial [Scutellospora calospora]
SQKAPEIIADGSYSKNLDVSTSSTSSLGPSMVVSHVSSPSTNTNNKDRLIKAKILEINYLRSESDKTKQKMKNLSESNILLEKENTELLERIKSLEKENAELKEKNNVRDLDLHLGSSSEDQELYEKIHLLEQEKSEFKDQIKTIEQENSELQNQIKTMKKEMSESKESFQLDK